MTEPLSLAELLSASGDIAYEWDLKSDSVTWFGDWKRIFDEETPPQDSQALYHTIHADDRHVVFSGDATAIDRKFRIVQASGGVIWVHERGTCEHDEKRNPIHQSGLWRIIDEPAHSIPIAEAQNRDALTGCFKRRALQGQVARAIVHAKGTRRVAAYMAVSVDKMSLVNEAIGTDAGDSVLRCVAARLSQLIPTRAALGRVGGDVFGILLPEPLGNNLLELADHIVKDFRDAPILVANSPMHITVSIGGVRMPTVAKTANDAMIFAEQALHMSRQRGRNTFIEYIDSPERAQENRQLLEMGERVKRAFKNDGFRLAYQPIVAADTRKPVCYEALVRMFGDDDKPIPAALFVPMIEQMGLVLDLDKFVLNSAVQVMKENPSLSLAINVSGLTASQTDWPEHMKKILEQHPDVAKRLIVEITETAAIANIPDTQRFSAMLRSLGGRVSLDDFGSGATSIRYLRDLKLSIMKIDKELLKNILTNPEQQHLVSVIIELARGLGIQTVAEGVETEEVALWLRKSRIDYMQGYLFGKPSLELPGADKAEPPLFPAQYA